MVRRVRGRVEAWGGVEAPVPVAARGTEWEGLLWAWERARGRG